MYQYNFYKTFDPWTPWYRERARYGKPLMRVKFYKNILKDCYQRMDYYQDCRRQEIQLMKDKLSSKLDRFNLSEQEKDYILNAYPLNLNPSNDYAEQYYYVMRCLDNYIKRLRQLISENSC